MKCHQEEMPGLWHSTWAIKMPGVWEKMHRKREKNTFPEGLQKPKQGVSKENKERHKAEITVSDT